MLIIDIKNVEEMIFYNKKLQNKLPDFKSIFGQWVIGKRTPMLKILAQKALLSFLEEIKYTHIKVLEEYFNTDIKISTTDYHTVKNLKVPIQELEDTLTNLKGFTNNYCIDRDEQHVYISFWR